MRAARTVTYATIGLLFLTLAPLNAHAQDGEPTPEPRTSSGSEGSSGSQGSSDAKGSKAADTTQSAGEVNIKKPHTGSRPFQLDVHAGFSYYGLGLAAGARFGIPILKNGFIPSLNNAVYINFGVDFYWTRWVDLDGRRYSAALGIPITMHWEFYFSKKWSAFGELGVNIYLHNSLLAGDGWDWSPGHWVIASVGGRYHINELITLTLRVGNPYTSFGISFML